MRTIPTSVQRVLDADGGGRSEYWRVLITVGGTDYDLTDLEDRGWVLGIEITEDIDSQAISGIVTLARDDDDFTLSPGVAAGKINALYGAGAPLISLYRVIVIECAIMPEGVEPAAGDWITMLAGRIVDLSWEPEIQITCQDIFSETLVATWVETPEEHGTALGRDVEDVIQDILTAWITPLSPILYTPVSPAWVVREYMQEEMPVWQALQSIVAEFGWCLGTRYHSALSGFRLTLFDPERTKAVPDHTFGVGQWLRSNAVGQSLADVRNVVKVVYGDEVDEDASGDPERESVTREDAASIALYGRRFCRITEAATSNIDTEAEAIRLGDAALADLSEPKIDTERVHPLFPFVQLCDLLRYEADGVQFDGDQDLAVVAIRHVASGGESETIISLRGAPASMVQGWLEREARPGIARRTDIYPPEIPAPTLNWYPDQGLRVNVDLSTVWHKLRKNLDRIEVHVKDGDNTDFTITTSTLIAKGRDQQFEFFADNFDGWTKGIGVRLVAVDRSGNRSAPTACVFVSFPG